MRKIFPKKLKLGDHVRVIAPACSLATIDDECQNNATKQLETMGLQVSFAKYSRECDMFNSSSVESRIADLHEAFADTDVACVLTVRGGYNSNQLLQYIDWELVKTNPKMLCGFSDITVLSNAIFAMTGLVAYSGPNYSTFGQKHINSYTLDYFKKCAFSVDPIQIQPSEFWSDYPWWHEQDREENLVNTGWAVINEGTVCGTILGANLCTLNLLHGTKYFPNLADSILFLEDDDQVSASIFDRDLQSLIHQSDFGGVKALVIGRFQKASKIQFEELFQIIKTKKELENIPVIVNVDFGHTEPKITFPVGGVARVSATTTDHSSIEILEH
jgi:muramoyltetrapeptide carboxypeptidase LdcA involved in peptidoglycan recycling